MPSHDGPDCANEQDWSDAVPGVAAPDAAVLDAFSKKVLEQGRVLYRDLPWRRTSDPYAIWVSEAMLQQTQVARVDGRWQRWLERFPTPEALAQAPAADVLREWQGLGYNRRALALQQAARVVVAAGGQIPQGEKDLLALPGVGKATAAGIRAFAFDLPGVYLETNVRTVLLHELFAGQEDVPDSRLVPVLQATCPCDASDPARDPRTWYYALLDFGAELKRTLPNPSRRSRTHVRQPRFEGSHRQKRAEVLRALLARPQGATAAQIAHAASQEEVAAGRPALEAPQVAALLAELATEGFCHCNDNIWFA